MAIFNLGRDFEAPIKIEDKHASVSHHHAILTVDGDNWILQDNDSTNGTYVEENGQFRRCARKTINPDTWIRLGEQGHRGYYFKARRVLRPNDYREDFSLLYDKYQELEETKNKLDANKKNMKFLTFFLLTAGLLVSLLPGIRDSFIGVRLCFMLPGALSPFLQDFLLNKYQEKIKELQHELICPKCRRGLGKDDILSRSHTFCKAQ